MTLAIILYYLVMCVGNAAILLVFALFYLSNATKSVRRWFLLYLVNAVGTAMTLGLEIAIRAGANAVFFRIIDEVRDITGLANIFLVPFFIHSYVDEKQGRIGNLTAFTAVIVAIVLSDAGIPLVGAAALGAAMLYMLILGGFIVARHGRFDGDHTGLKSIIIISAAFFPWILLNIAAGYGLFSGNVNNVLMIDGRSPLFIATALVLFFRIRPEGRAADMVIGEDRLAVLSEREREVAEYLLSGDTNKQIADRLCIAESTVKKHIHSIFGKLDISSRWELVKLRKLPE